MDLGKAITDRCAGYSFAQLFINEPRLVEISEIIDPVAGATGAYTASKWNVPGVPRPTDEEIAEALAAPESASVLAAQLSMAAETICAQITSQLIPNATYKNAYDNAAAIVWANGGKAPGSEPVKTVFASLGVSIGITDLDAFAAVVSAVSLGSMQLSAILSTLQAAGRAASNAGELAAALSVFERDIDALLVSLNCAGLTFAVSAPASITIAGINA